MNKKNIKTQMSYALGSVLGYVRSGVISGKEYLLQANILDKKFYFINCKHTPAESSEPLMVSFATTKAPERICALLEVHQPGITEIYDIHNITETAYIDMKNSSYSHYMQKKTPVNCGVVDNFNKDYACILSNRDRRIG